MLYVVDKLRQRQAGSPGHHARLTGVDPRNGQTVTMPIQWWFSEQFSDQQEANDFALLGALRNPINGWITPGNAGTSPLLTQLVTGNGDMAAAFADYLPAHVVVAKALDDQRHNPYTFRQILALWIDGGCTIGGVVEPSLKMEKQVQAKGRLSIRGKGKPGVPGPEIAPPATKYVRPHRIYGMGVPH
jgi:hypothetical protein